jgi:hypothetical protein
MSPNPLLDNNQELFSAYLDSVPEDQLDSPQTGGLLLHLLGGQRWRVRCNPDGYSFLSPSDCKHKYKYTPVATLSQACIGAARALGWLADD